MRRILFAALFVALLVGGWKFAADNADTVIVHHPVGALPEVKLWVALLGAFASGVVLATLVGMIRGARIRLVTRRYRKLTAGLQAEVHELRNLPLTGDVPDPASAPSSGRPAALEEGS